MCSITAARPNQVQLYGEFLLSAARRRRLPGVRRRERRQQGLRAADRHRAVRESADARRHEERDGRGRRLAGTARPQAVAAARKRGAADRADLRLRVHQRRGEGLVIVDIKTLVGRQPDQQSPDALGDVQPERPADWRFVDHAGRRLGRTSPPTRCRGRQRRQPAPAEGRSRDHRAAQVAAQRAGAVPVRVRHRCRRDEGHRRHLPGQAARRADGGRADCAGQRDLPRPDLRLRRGGIGGPVDRRHREA